MIYNVFAAKSLKIIAEYEFYYYLRIYFFGVLLSFKKVTILLKTYFTTYFFIWRVTKKGRHLHRIT